MLFAASIVVRCSHVTGWGGYYS